MKTEVQLFNKAITIDDLSNSDHIGFIDSSGKKAFVLRVNADSGYIAVTAFNDNGQNSYWNLTDSLVKAIKNVDEYTCYTIVNLYRFDTRKELYQWLAED